MPLAGNVLQSKKQNETSPLRHLPSWFSFALPARFLFCIVHEISAICKGFFLQKRNDCRITIHILQLNIGAAYV